MAGGGGKEEKNYVIPFVDASGKKILMQLFASVKRFGVSRMRDFCKYVIKNQLTLIVSKRVADQSHFGLNI